MSGLGKDRKTQAVPVSVMVRSQTPDPRWSGEMGTKDQNVKGRLGVAKRKHPVSKSNWEKSQVSARRWESEKHKSRGMPVEGFRHHVATDGTLWSACGWSAAQLRHDEEMGQCIGCMVR